MCWSVEINRSDGCRSSSNERVPRRSPLPKDLRLRPRAAAKGRRRERSRARAATAKTGVQFQNRGVSQPSGLFRPPELTKGSFLATGPAPENTSDHPPTPISGRPVFGIQLRTPGIPPNAVRPADDLPGRARHRQTRRSVPLHLRNSIDASFMNGHTRLQTFSRPCKSRHDRAERQLRYARYFFIRKLFDMCSTTISRNSAGISSSRRFRSLAVDALYQSVSGSSLSDR